MSDDYGIFNEYERQSYQAAIDLDEDLENAVASEFGDRTVTDWIKSKYVAHAASLYNFNAILDAIREDS